MSAIGARMLLVRIHHERGETERANALIAELGRLGGRRRLLHNPPFQLAVQEVVIPPFSSGQAMLRTVSNRMADNVEDQWIEVGFWVQPGGGVDDLQIVRRSAGRGGWEAPLLDSIRGRIYSTGNEATYRLERYTYTSGYETRTGSRIAQRSPLARIEYFDLTGGEPARP